MSTTVGDPYHQTLIQDETANAMVGIVNATEKYDPRPT